MDFITSLGSFSLVRIDMPIFIYHLEGHSTYLPLTQALLSNIKAGEKKGMISTITLMEIAVRPLQLERPEVAIKYRALLSNFPNLSLVDIDRDIARQAAQLMAQYHLRPVDALQVATCQVYDAQVLVTHDRRLAQLKPEIEIVALDDFIASCRSRVASNRLDWPWTFPGPAVCGSLKKYPFRKAPKLKTAGLAFFKDPGGLSCPF